MIFSLLLSSFIAMRHRFPRVSLKNLYGGNICDRSDISDFKLIANLNPYPLCWNSLTEFLKHNFSVFKIPVLLSSIMMKILVSFITIHLCVTRPLCCVFFSEKWSFLFCKHWYYFIVFFVCFMGILFNLSEDNSGCFKCPPFPPSCFAYVCFVSSFHVEGFLKWQMIQSVYV